MTPFFPKTEKGSPRSNRRRRYSSGSSERPSCQRSPLRKKLKEVYIRKHQQYRPPHANRTSRMMASPPDSPQASADVASNSRKQSQSTVVVLLSVSCDPCVSYDPSCRSPARVCLEDSSKLLYHTRQFKFCALFHATDELSRGTP